MSARNGPTGCSLELDFEVQPQCLGQKPEILRLGQPRCEAGCLRDPCAPEFHRLQSTQADFLRGEAGHYHRQSSPMGRFQCTIHAWTHPARTIAGLITVPWKARKAATMAVGVPGRLLQAFRHFFASCLIVQGFGPERVQALMAATAGFRSRSTPTPTCGRPRMITSGSPTASWPRWADCDKKRGSSANLAGR